MSLKDLNLPFWPSLIGCDTYEHITSINTQMTIIRTLDSLKWNFLLGTPMYATLRWYMYISRAFIANYEELEKELVHQFTTNRHRKMSSTIRYNIRQSPLKLLKDYLVWFNEATITVVPPNKEMFVRVFQNGIKAGHFNESLAHKSTPWRREMLKRMRETLASVFQRWRFTPLEEE